MFFIEVWIQISIFINGIAIVMYTDPVASLVYLVCTESAGGFENVQ